MLTKTYNENRAGSHSASKISSVEPWLQSQAKLWSTLKEVCDLLRIPVSQSMAEEKTAFQHMQFRAGQRIHTIGQQFDTLYIVYSGFLKTVMIDDAGGEQILGFPMKGDLFGVDGIHAKQYTAETVALSNCDIILVPFKTFTALGKIHSDLDTAVYGVMSRELVREHAMISMLGSLSAEARVARFLAFLSERYGQMGYSKTQFNLRMNRQEIGSYLGLTLETVSRTFSALNTIGLITTDQRSVVINDINALKTLRRLPLAKVRAKQQAAKAAKKAAEQATITATAGEQVVA
jgi:CRP/FNR family transcriptional regulator